MEGVTVKAISSNTRKLISELLNPEMPLSLSEEGLVRDWRGLFVLCGINQHYMENLREHQDPTMKVLRLWQEKDETGSTVDVLATFFKRLDRYDLVYKITPLLEEDCKKYNAEEHDAYEPPFDIYTIDDVTRNNQGFDEPQMYDAFVLFADDDINFATEIIETLERQYNLKLCTKDRDVIASGDEYIVMLRIIQNRCEKLIVVLSPAFFDSPLHTFLLRFGQGMALETKQDKIIPCTYKRFEKLPADLFGCFLIDYTRKSKLWNFWEILYNAIKKQQPSKIRSQLQAQMKPQRKLSNRQLAAEDKDMLKPIAQAIKFSSMGNLSSRETETIIKPQPLISSPSLGDCSDKKKKTKNWIKKFLPKSANKANDIISSKPTNISKDKKKCWNLQNKKAADAE